MPYFRASAVTGALAVFLLASQVVAAQAVLLKEEGAACTRIPPWPRGNCASPFTADEELHLTDEQAKKINKWNEENKKFLEEAEKEK